MSRIVYLGEKSRTQRAQDILGQNERFEEALSRVSSFSIEPGLQTIFTLLELLGQPHETLKAIHITGTNGKGSVSAMLSSIFNCAGYRVGTYTSPHLVSYGERFQLNGHSACWPVLWRLFYQVQEAAQKAKQRLGHPPTIFEILTAMAFLYFSQMELDILVLEVGMGGRYDATNVLNQPLATVITNISLDHMDYLGSGLEDIAYEKTGIIKHGAPLFSGETNSDLKRSIEATFRLKNPQDRVQWTDERCFWTFKKAPPFKQVITLTTPLREYAFMELGLLGYHQASNGALAVLVAESLEALYPKVTKERIEEGLSKVVWPGRMEIIQHRPMIIMDGAHNPAGMKSLSLWLQKNRALYGKVHLMMGMLQDKDRREAALTMVELVDTVWITRPPSTRAGDWSSLSDYFIGEGKSEVRLIEDPWSCFKKVQAGAKTDDLILITGSLYLIGWLKARLQEDAVL